MPTDHRETFTAERPSSAGGGTSDRQAAASSPPGDAHVAGEADDAWMYEPLDVTEGRMTPAELVLGALCLAALAGMLLYVLIETGLLGGLIIALSIAR